MSRRQVKRPFKRKIFIICEGETEICYFKSLKSIYHSDLGSQIEPVGPCLKLQTTTPGSREGFYRTRKTRILEKFSIGKSQNERNLYVNKVYIIVDIDDHQNNNHYSKMIIDQMIKFFKSKGWIILFSNRDIETFIYSHINYSESTKGCLGYVKDKYPSYDKGDNLNLQDAHKEIINNDGINRLKKNMQKLEKYHENLGSTHIYDMNPYSQVIEIIKELKI